ncbi:xanthine dehydrogenase, molybdenum-binding subunit XdhA [Gottschalkia acidurici 9a]|uniref:Xanthine dehydrogenase, molybdenum-binding subunit XdhA n=1 Tax=Gottschalkia acidurici (strain ATCC 7906 / DSM 604 / BCRC 14475 / CIP 104303 / KCTC 5404 / NCIMB 10678 / 9a) TaxID=1128398 RepID=K0B2W0_GOTA9|nr:xanthine dehydrogenase family protein molybdopterin-binding subunit [Gottschalkia acidurici]AFS78946.1 xanthine dehydrogenase, molybdenum-binding subunit XdhA [Gottschalkia acidurici 9a]
MADLKQVGKSIIRRDGVDKLTGKAIYPEDIIMEDMAYGATVRSPYAHAKIVAIDTKKAKSADGVLEVFTADDVPGENAHGVLYRDHNVFCKEKVRRIGDPVAFVVAETQEQARDAAKLVEVTYEELPAIFSPEEGLKSDAPVVNDYSDRFFFYDKDMNTVYEKPENIPYPNLIFRYKGRKGECESESIWKECAAIAESEFNSPFVESAFLQPESGIAYVDENDKIVVTVSTQYMHFDRTEIAEALNVDEKRVRVVNPAIGGAFGAREDISLQIHLAIAALRLRRPVKATYTREESFYAHSKRHPMKIKAKMGANKEGKLIAFEAEIYSDSGAYASWAINITRKACVHVTGPYQIPNVKVDGYSVYTNNPFGGAMRGFGATQVPIVSETLIDMLAEKLDIDKFEIRKKNIFRVGSETANGQIITESCPLDVCIDTVEKAMGKENIDNKSNKSYIKKGRGIAAAWYGTGYGNGFPDVSVADVELLKDGSVLLRVGAAEVGQGAKTVMPQIAAEVLGMDPSEIKISSEDTEECEDSGTAAATRQTYNTGNAVKLASEKFKSELIKEAVKLINKPLPELARLNSNHKFKVENGEVYLEILPKMRVTLAEIAKNLAEEGKNLRVRESFTAQTVMLDDNAYGAPYWPYTFNSYGVEVEVDTLTGRVQCTDAWCAQDVGKAVNPILIEGQIDGGFAMGLGYVLYEDLGVSNGKIKNNKFSKYIIPTAMDMPNINKYIIESPETSAPFGAKGIGEPVILPVAPSIVNAIYDAVGIRLTSLPVTPDKVLKALKEKEENESKK